jgi:molecular chaperone GrpE
MVEPTLKVEPTLRPDPEAPEPFGATTPAPSEPLPAEPATASPVDEQLRKAEAEAAEHREAFLRAKAEGDNIRKRAQVEVTNAHKFAVENFASGLLAVKDSLEAALIAENASVESMKSGVELTLKQLVAVFERFNLAEINPQGQKFDPHRHQAIGTLEAEAEPNTVVKVLQKGYLLHDRVIRPALVMVSKTKNA